VLSGAAAKEPGDPKATSAGARTCAPGGRAEKPAAKADPSVGRRVPGLMRMDASPARSTFGIRRPLGCLAA